jgi:hypothetical protein
LVKLPSGEHAVAKLCKCYNCYARKLVAEEAEVFRGLYKQFSDEGGLRVFGECYVPFDNLPSKKRSTSIKKLASRFSVGHTSVIDMGKPLLKSRNSPMDKSNHVFWFFNESDVRRNNFKNCLFFGSAMTKGHMTVLECKNQGGETVTVASQ